MLKVPYDWVCMGDKVLERQWQHEEVMSKIGFMVINNN